LIYLKVVGVSIGSLAVLFILTKIIGNKQLSQINMFDYINSITIGSIAAEMATSDKENFLVPLIAMVIYGLAAALIGFITIKSMKGRRFLNGCTTILMDDNKIYLKNIKKARLDINEILSQFRLNGYFDISQIHAAYLEPNGRISIIPKEGFRPITPSDMKLPLEQSKAGVIVIVDGKLLNDNLKFSSVDKKWLKNQLKSEGIKDISEVALASLADKKKLTVYKKNSEKPKNDYFE